MTVIYVALLIITLLLVINVIVTIRSGSKKGTVDITSLRTDIEFLTQNLQNTERNLKTEFITNRKEIADNLKGVRDEIGLQLNNFTKTFSSTLVELTKSTEIRLDAVRTTIEEKLSTFQLSIETTNRENRKELKEALDIFKLEISNSLKDFSNRQRDNFNDLLKTLDTQNINATSKLDQIRDTVEKKISELQKGNEQKLDEMRKTVDEKLNETLEKRLNESFRVVSERLEAVHQGLGDMQNLAKDVGNLNKTMNNVKSRGILGEYQLQNLLEDLLTNDQYEKNVKTKERSGAMVEFAIKMPNGNDVEKSLWLPIDSKFPKEDYECLVDAYEKGDIAYIEECRRNFVKSIRKSAVDIKEKYIDPPNTTEYGLMFLPFESLYAEVLRTPGLFEQLQRDYKITIAGPTTLSAFLNSLQMGFRTLAIEKRSSEVWDLLGAVKTEFGKFGDILAKTRKKLEEATNVIDDASVRTRVIERRLRTVQELPQEKVLGILNNDTSYVENEDQVE